VRKRIGSGAFWVVVVVVLLVLVFPIFWIYLTSFKPPEYVYSLDPGRLFAFGPTLANYEFLFTEKPLFVRAFVNTAVIATISTGFVMVVSLPAAYSFARWNTGAGNLLFITISTRMFPPVIAAIPFFVLFRSMHLMDTHVALILLYLYFNMSFATFLLFGFFREIPVELEQAARVDGYGLWDIFRRIIFPLIRPGAAITAVFCFVFAWNEFLYAFLFTSRVARTLPLEISAFWGALSIQWGPMAAAVGLGILPTLIIAWFMQRYIIRGLTFGAVKG